VGDIIPRRLRVPHTAATITVASAPASMTRDGPAGHHQEETTRHVRQDATTPAAPVGCAIPPPTTHSGSIVQLRERLSPGGGGGAAAGGVFEAGAVFSKPGQDHQKLFDLTSPGQYGYFCPITTPAGTPHYQLGFVGLFDVAAG
jgi:hypothetical protein